MDFSKEYSEMFDDKRKARVKTSFFKHGPVAENYRNGNIQAIPTCLKCIEKYEETGNTEYLCDAANYLMFEFMFPQHKDAHFRSTDSKESAGIVGLSVNEAKAYMEQEG